MDESTRKRRDLWIRKILVVGLFIGLSILFTITFYINGRLGIDSNGSFHFSRVEEIYRNLKEGSFFTFIATHTFHNSGVGSFLFYPSVFIYPWATLRFIFDPLRAFYVWYGLVMFLTMAIAYYVMFKFSKRRIRAIIFAIFYAISAYHLYLGLRNYVIGEFIAYTFVPLVMYGFYEVVFGDAKKWPLLSMGVALLLYSHLLSTVMAVAIMAVIFIISLICGRIPDKVRWSALAKSVGLALLLSAWMIYPFITDYLKSDLGTPLPGFSFQYTMQEFWAASLENSATNRGIGIALLIAALFGWYFVKSDRRERIIYALGLTFIVLSTSLFPYSVLQRVESLSFLQVIQFPYRFSVYSSFFLAIVLSLMVTRLFDNKKKYQRIVTLLGVVSVASLLYFNSVTLMIDRISDPDPNVMLRETDDRFATVPQGAVLDHANYKLLFDYLVLYGETDYYPKQSFANNYITTNPAAQSIILHHVKVGEKVIEKTPVVAPNEITYQVALKKKATVDLPVIVYPGTKVYVNGKNVSHETSKRGTVMLNLNQGTYKITTRYEMSKIYYSMLFIALLSWGGLAIVGVRKCYTH